MKALKTARLQLNRDHLLSYDSCTGDHSQSTEMLCMPRRKSHPVLHVLCRQGLFLLVGVSQTPLQMYQVARQSLIKSSAKLKQRSLTQP